MAEYRKYDTQYHGRPERGKERLKKHLPMDDYRQEVVETVSRSDSAVIIGETGSGKTTRLPQYLMDQYPDARIAVSQPRKLAARSVAKHVAEEVGCRLGDEVGSQVRFEDRTSERTRVNFMTDGILLQLLKRDRLLRDYDIVMVDEAHERSINIDVSLGMLKAAQRARKEAGLKPLKIVVASATIEKSKFTKYFGQAPAVEVPGRTYEVEIEYEADRISDICSSAANKVKAIAEGGESGDILIFMPGEDDINLTIRKIDDLQIDGIDVMPLYGSMAPDDQDKIFRPNAKRKVIVATNIAETSITIDGVNHVIDSGLIKQKNFDVDTGMETFGVESHSQSGCQQRAGRAGRTAPGHCYRLFTEQQFSELNKFQKPEIARSSLEQVILFMKRCGIDDIKSFEFIDPPPLGAISQGIDRLKVLGALDDEGNITEDGKIMAELPLSPDKGKMILEARRHRCVGKIATIVAMQGERPVMVYPRDKEKKAAAGIAHRKFKDSSSDFLTMLNLWEAWEESGFDYGWAKENYLSTKRLQEIGQIRSQLLRDLKNNGVEVDDANGGNREEIQKCVVAGAIGRLVRFVGYYAYKPIEANDDSEYDLYYYIHPASATFSSGGKLMIGENVVINEGRDGSGDKTYMRTCQNVDPDWLPEVAPQLIEKVESDSEIRYDSGRDEVVDHGVYAFKNNPQLRLESNQKAKNSKETAKAYATAVAEIHAYLREIDQSSIKANMERLKELRKKAGDAVTVPDLAEWYYERLGGACSNHEAKDLIYNGKIGKMEFDIKDFCSVNPKEIERECPDKVTIRGFEVPIYYIYNVDQGKSGSASYPINVPATTEHYALISLTKEQAAAIEEADIPALGLDGNLEIRFSYASDNSSNRFRSLAELKKWLNVSPGQSGYQSQSPFREYYGGLSEPERDRTYGLRPTRSLTNTEANYFHAGSSGDSSVQFGSLRMGPAAPQKPKEAVKPKPVKEVTNNKPQEAYIEKMTDALKAGFVEEIANARIFLEVAAQVVPPDNIHDPAVAKAKKLKEQVKEIRRDLNALEKELLPTDDVARIRSKTAELSKKAENAAGQSARLSAKAEGWTDRYRQYLSEIKKMAKSNDLDLSAKSLEGAMMDIAALAQRSLPEGEASAELENILISAI